MTRFTATALGVVLAAGLAIAAPQDAATDLVNRYYASTTEAELAAGWKDWHPDASHQITVLTGMTYGDFEFSYAMSDWETLPDWTEDPELAAALKGYEEVSRSEPVLTVASEADTTTLTGETKVAYVWDGYKGTMTQTDRFTITTTLGRPVIRNLQTVYDYR